MSHFSSPRLTRRSLLAGGAGLAASAALGLPRQAAAAPLTEVKLVAGTASQKLNGPQYPATNVWCYSGRVPGPEIRVPQGGSLRVTAENRLDVATTVHWHGLRIPNAMDGVPYLTQEPIAPGESFVYEFDCPDAGTFWYHPHLRGFEQVGRGLYGPLIVEEPEGAAAPLGADRELTWVLDDWRLTEDGLISEDFGNMHDVAHAGRLGNTATLNGGSPETIPVRAGERIRLRLLNAANARIFGLTFEGHAPQIVAIDGQPVAPHASARDRVVLAPAMRIDLVIDMTGSPGERFRVIDDYYPQMAYRLTELAYSSEPLRDTALPPPEALPANPLPEPDLDDATLHEIALGGGMMGNMMAAMVEGREVDIRTMIQNGLAWAINGVAATGHVLDPMLTLERDRTYVFAMNNDTAWPHPMHLHGHSFRVVARNGRPTELREWQDTVLVPPRQSVDVVFVADNPGDWMFHCHILEHMLGGMMGVVRVT
jgi:FtsP/CotA-like multicopper oxidase with cupredoxin domain